MSSPEPDLQKLHRDCLSALRAYIAEASRTCKLLDKVAEFPMSPEQQENLLQQRQFESHAQERYQRARLPLFDAIKRNAASKRG
jgi:hypothetical protein